MWFVPTQQPPGIYVFDRLINRLAHGSTEVSALFATDPFGGNPPIYLRVLAYKYRFTTSAEQAESGNWWHRGILDYFPGLPQNAMKNRLRCTGETTHCKISLTENGSIIIRAL